MPWRQRERGCWWWGVVSGRTRTPEARTPSNVDLGVYLAFLHLSDDFLYLIASNVRTFSRVVSGGKK